ncbi:MAG: hypothetical protein AAGA20_10750 [Planctomycetota bacterium]
MGFPGETDADFAETVATAERAGFSRVHVFPFSARPGTAAAELGGHVRPEVIRERRAALSEAAAGWEEAFRRGLDGAPDRVVLEGFVGLSGRYQRVAVDPGALEGPPPAALDVNLEARIESDPGGAPTTRLWGHPAPVDAR